MSWLKMSPVALPLATRLKLAKRTTITWAWFCATAIDERLYRRLKFSPLLHLLKRLATPRPSAATVHRNACLRIKPAGRRRASYEICDAAPPGETPQHRNGAHLLSYFYNDNLALILRSALFAYRHLRRLGWSPHEVRVLNLNPEIGRGKTLDGVLDFFADMEPLSRLPEGFYRLDALAEVSGSPDLRFVMERAVLEEFRAHVLRGRAVEPAPPTAAVKRITLVSRAPMAQEGRLIPVSRKMSNEDELLEALRRRYPSVETTMVRLEDRALNEQFELINRTDLLVGMHGAGLGYSMLLPPNAAVLEIFPCNFRFSHYFYTFYGVCLARGLHYRRKTLWSPGYGSTGEAYGKAMAAALQKNPRGPLHDDLSRMDRHDSWRVPVRPVVRRAGALLKSVERGAEKRT